MDYKSLSEEELERLVVQKDGEAICELGERCMYGSCGHEINLTRAYQLFHKGEKMGLSRAYAGLGEMYRNGIRFAKNETLAREYYRKANVPYPNEESKERNPKSVNEILPVKQSPEQDKIARKPAAIVSDREIWEKLEAAESLRKKNDYEGAKAACKEVIQRIGTVSAGGNTRAMLADAYWILAFTAFNQHSFSEMEQYLAKAEVKKRHPWGVYLAAVSHRLVQAPDAMIEQDLHNLIGVCSSQLLSSQDLGDIYALIAELVMEGYGKQKGDTMQAARTFYKKAADCGNEYAREQWKILS